MSLPVSTHLRRGGQPLVWLAVVFSALFLLMSAPPASAQQAGGAPAAEASESTPESSGESSPESTAEATPESTSGSTPENAVSYGALADTLEDPAARDKLVEQLRALSQAQADGAAPKEQNPAQEEFQVLASGIAVLSQRLGNELQELTAQLGSDIQQTIRAFSRLGSSDGVTEGKLGIWLPALRVLALVIVATLVAYGGLRALAALLFSRLNAWIRRRPGESKADAEVANAAAAEGTAEPVQVHPNSPKARYRLRRITFSRRLLGVLLAFVVDIGATLLAALAGYVAAVALSDREAYTGTFAFQFLTAFVLIEIVKSVSRAVFATRYDHLRLMPLEPDTANYWNRWITLLIALTGYCLMVVVPVGQAVFAPSIGRLIGLVIMVCVYVTALRVIWSQKEAVRAGMMQSADKSDTAVYGTLMRALARVWHWLAFAYFTVLLVASQAEQAAALTFMMSATVQSVSAVVVGAILTAGLTRLESHHFKLPDTWTRGFPLLEQRVNSYKDPALRGIHLALVVIVILLVLDAWQAFDLGAWLDSERGRATVALVLRVGIVLATAALVWTVLASLIEHRVGAREGMAGSEREKTLLMLFRNAAAIVIVTMTVLVLLSQIGIDIGPLIAGAGVVGLAIGFGAQKLVQDVITGVFIQLENGMNQNDIVEVAGRFGTVEKITVRSVVIRTLDGGYHLIPFSAIDTVSNHTRDFGYHYAEYNIAHREDVDQAVAQLEAAFKDLMSVPELAAEVLAEIEIPGVTALNERGFSIRVLIKTRPGSQWMIQRAFNRYVKQRFDANGIELPYPQTVVHFGRDRDGQAAPVEIRAVDAVRESVEGAGNAGASGPGAGSGRSPGPGAPAGGDANPESPAGPRDDGVVPAPGQTLRPGPGTGPGPG